MDFLKKIPTVIYLICSLIFITAAIAALFLGKYTFTVLLMLIGLISLIAWTFYGLFEETKNT